MATLHDPAVRTSLEARLNALHPDSVRQWGTMTADQMLWHVNQFLAATLGEVSLPLQKIKVPMPIMKFFLLYMPWPKGAPTNQGAVAKGRYDFEAEKARCRELIGRFASRPMNGAWPVDPTWGPVTGTFQSRLQAKHLDYHFKQFSA